MINSFIKSYYNLDYKNLFYILKNSELMSLNDFEIIKRLGNLRRSRMSYAKAMQISSISYVNLTYFIFYRRRSIQ
jgi:hypothetical protein